MQSSIFDRIDQFASIKLTPAATLLLKRMIKDIGGKVRQLVSTSSVVTVEEVAELGDYVVIQTEDQGQYALSLNVLEGQEPIGDNTLIADFEASGEVLITTVYGTLLAGLN